MAQAPVPEARPVDRVIGLLAEMSDDDKRRVRDAAMAMLDGASGRSDIAQAWDALRVHLPQLPAWARVCNRQEFRSAESALSSLWLLAESVSPGEAYVAAVGFGFAIKAELDRVGVPPALRVVLARVRNIEAVLERQFPGYTSSGLLGLVLKGRLRGTPDSDSATDRRNPVVRGPEAGGRAVGRCADQPS